MEKAFSVMSPIITPTAIIVEGIDGVGKTTFIEELSKDHPLISKHNSETTVETFADNVADLKGWKQFHIVQPFGSSYKHMLYAVDRWYLSGLVYRNSGLDLRWNNIFREQYYHQLDILHDLNKYVDSLVNLKLYIEPCWNCYELSEKTKTKLKSNVMFQLYETEYDGYISRLKQIDKSYKYYLKVMNDRYDTLPYLIVKQHDLVFAKVIIKALSVNSKFNSSVIIEMNKHFYRETKEYSYDIMSCEKLLKLYGTRLHH